MEKIIHSVWIGEAVPDKVKMCMDSWKRYCPDWEIKVWNETNLPMEVHWIKSCYDKGGWALGFLVDYVKAWAIYTYGGIWADADTQIIGGLDALANKKGFVFSHIQGRKVCTSFIGGSKGDKVWKHIMDFYQDRDCPNYKHRYSWNSIYKYAALIKEHEGDIPLGDVGNIFDKGNIRYIMVDSLDKLQPYANHLNMATWGRASKHKKRLSVLLPFKNEREEVALTCKSIRDTAGDMVEIIVLNDDSNKDFDYKASLAPYNVEYHESEKRLGSSMGKQWCVDHCKTPYFLILDAHCRIYTKNWLKLALDELEKDEDCVYCCAVQYFSNEQDHQSPKHMKAFGGFWDYNIKSILSCGWNLHNFSYEKDKNLPSDKWEAFEVPCILGANYLCSKRWWDYLNGYNGLMLYGREETFISKKSWMAGGKVKCMPSILTGHKTRPNNHQPYACCAYEVIHNEMVNGYILFDDEEFNDLMEVWKSIHNPLIVRDAINLFNTHKEQLDMLRLQFRSIKKVSHDEVDAFNAAFQKKMGFNYALLQKNIEGTYTKYGEKEHKPIPIG